MRTGISKWTHLSVEAAGDVAQCQVTIGLGGNDDADGQHVVHVAQALQRAFSGSARVKIDSKRTSETKNRKME